MIHGYSVKMHLYKCLQAGDGATLDERVNITLSLVGLRNEKVGNVSTDVVFVTDGVSTKDFL